MDLLTLVVVGWGVTFGVLGIILFLRWWIRGQQETQFRVVFYRKVSDRYVKVGEKKIKRNDKIVEFNNRDKKKKSSFNIDLARVDHQDRNKVYLSFDVDNGDSLSKNKSAPSLDPTKLATATTDRVIQEYFESSAGFGRQFLIGLLIGGVMGMLGGFIIAQFVHLPVNQAAPVSNGGNPTA